MIVADLDDNLEPAPTTSSRPRRTNAGAGVERIQMDSTGKGYGTRCEFNFDLVTNGITESKKQEESSQHTLMQVACDAILTQTAKQGASGKQMSATKGIKNMVN